MIKLCSMDDYLSFGDIMKKIAVLESRLTSTSLEKCERQRETLSDPPSGWAPDTAENHIEEKIIGEADVEDFRPASFKNPVVRIGS